jgi:gliding motility-associated-like protein
VPDAICPGGSSSLTATGGATYSWTPAATLSSATSATPTATPAATTTYVVTGSSAAGCTDTGIVTVTVKPTPSVTAAAATPSACVGTPTQLTAAGAATYVWSPATGLSCTTCANPLASPLTTTTYIVTGTAANGCTDTGIVVAGVNAPPQVTVGGPVSICIGSSAQLQGNGAATYVWSPATGLSCTTCSNPVANPTATTTYTVIGTNAAGCKDTDVVIVTVNPLPVVNTNTPGPACQGIGIPLTATGAATYTWTPGAGLSCTACANPTATPAATTTYTVTGTTAAGCSATKTVTVNVLPLPPVNAGPDVQVCGGASTQLQATGAASYVWSPGAGLSCTTCVDPVATPQTPTSYVVTGTGANGCVASDAVQVGFFPQPDVDAGPDKTICAGQTVQLQASGAFTYLWTPPTGLSCTGCAAPFAGPANTTTYSLLGTDVNGCQDSDRVVVTVIQKLPVTVSPGGEICENESFQLNASGGDGYLWTPSTGLSCTTCPNPTATPTTTTVYSVVISQGQCFAETQTVEVIVHPKPTINAGPDQKVIAGNGVVLNATSTDASIYKWSPPTWLSCTNCLTPTATPLQNITYKVLASNQWGCEAEDDVIITVGCDNSQLWLPNTFTPNGDGANDRFYPHGKGMSTVKLFRIYNRWGELLFSQADMPVDNKDIGWDGTWKGQQLKPDVYVYIVNTTCLSTGEPLEIKGDVSIVR